MMSFMRIFVSRKDVEGPNNSVQDGHGKIGVDLPEYRLVTKTGTINRGNEVSPEAQGNDGEDDGGIDSELVVLVVAMTSLMMIMEQRRPNQEGRHTRDDGEGNGCRTFTGRSLGKISPNTDQGAPNTNSKKYKNPE